MHIVVKMVIFESFGESFL